MSPFFFFLKQLTFFPQRSTHLDQQTHTHSHAHKLPSGLFLGWMLRRVVESRAPDRPRGSFFGMDNRGRRSCRTQGQCVTALTKYCVSKVTLTCLRPRFRPNGGWIRRFCWPGSLCTLATLVQPIRGTDNTQGNRSLRREQTAIFTSS